MKAISLWQPWASLWLSPAKVHETRHWPTRHRSWLAVHAAKRLERIDYDDPLATILRAEFGSSWATSLPRGAILGVVKLLDCRPTEVIMKEWGCPPGPVDIAHWEDYQCGDFAAGRFGWQRGGFMRLPRPIPFRGMQGIFAIPDAVAAAIIDNLPQGEPA